MNKRKIFIFINFVVIFSFGAFLCFASSPPGLQDLNPLSSETLGDFIDNITTALFYLGMIGTPIGILIGGLYMLSGIPSQQIKGKRIIAYSLAILAFIIVLKWTTSITKDIIG